MKNEGTKKGERINKRGGLKISNGGSRRKNARKEKEKKQKCNRTRADVKKEKIENWLKGTLENKITLPKTGMKDKRADGLGRRKKDYNTLRKGENKQKNPWSANERRGLVAITGKREIGQKKSRHDDSDRGGGKRTCLKPEKSA